MSKIAATLIALLAVACTPAQASQSLCGEIAEGAVAVADAAKHKVPWDKVDKIATRDKEDLGLKLQSAVTSVYTEAYYAWATFDATSIRQLAYMKCQNLLKK